LIRRKIELVLASLYVPSELMAGFEFV